MLSKIKFVSKINDIYTFIRNLIISINQGYRTREKSKFQNILNTMSYDCVDVTNYTNIFNKSNILSNKF